MSDNKANATAIIVAIIGVIGTVVSTYIATQKDKEVTDAKQESNKEGIRYDSLLSAYNSLNGKYNALIKQSGIEPVIPAVEKPDIEPPKLEEIYSLPTIVESRQGQYLLQVKRITGYPKNKRVIVEFLTTNEQYSGYATLYMNESIANFQGKTYYAISAVLGDKTGEGLGQYTTPQMQVVKGEPLAASITMLDVPSAVSQFSTCVINMNGEKVLLKNLPITWK